MGAGRSRMRRASACTVYLLISISAGMGCFPPPNPKPDSLADSGGPSETVVDTNEGADADLPAESDANPGDTVAVDEGPDAIPDSETLACERNDECVGLAAPPCTVGVCDNHRCTKQFASVACDDRDPCTTADRCEQGACQGRAFTGDEARNWSMILAATGDSASVWPTDVVAFSDGRFGVVGRFRGLLDLGGTAKLDRPDGALFYARIGELGTRLVDLDLSDAGAVPEGAGTLVPHRLDADGLDAVILGSVSQSQGPNLSALTRLSASGAALWAPGPWFPGTAFRAIPMDANETMVFGTFTGEVTFRLKTGSTRTLTARGASDFYVARLNDDREVLWINIVSSDGADRVGSFIVQEGDGFYWRVKLAGAEGRLNDAPLTPGVDGFIGIRVAREGFATADERPVSASLGAPVAGLVLGDGSVVASAAWGDPAGASFGYHLQRFALGVPAPAWNLDLLANDALGGLIFGGPTVLPMANDASLMVWVVLDGMVVEGWPETHAGLFTSTLFGVVSPSGVVASAWALPGFSANPLDYKATPVEVMAGNAAVALTPDGGVVLAAPSLGGTLGAEFGGQTVGLGSGVILKYSPAHVWGCPVAP